MMNRREERDLVVSYTDRLLGLEPGQPQSLTRNGRVQGLLTLADHLQAILVPVEPDPAFRRRLHGDLILEGQRMGGEPEAGLFEQHRKGILIGAALGSVASVLGVVIAVVIRQRHQRATNVATG
ncbi:MAG: hypothetical protein M8467_00900 [Anaerolineae bacterium]|nr:hypothetical protein [Anaerolineae bacterium]